MDQSFNSIQCILSVIYIEPFLYQTCETLANILTFLTNYLIQK